MFLSKVQNAWMFNFDKFYDKIIFIWSIFGYKDCYFYDYKYLELLGAER